MRERHARVCVCVNACPKGLKGKLWRSLQRGDVGAESYLLDHADGTDPEDDPEDVSIARAFPARLLASRRDH